MPMTENSYLIALALLEQGDRRLMPLGGRSLKKPMFDIIENREFAESIALELLVRILQRSCDGEIRRIAGDKSLLLVDMPLSLMQERLPLIKRDWIQSGNTENLLLELQKCSLGIWSLDFKRYEGIRFVNCK